MKTSVRIVILATACAFASMSCQKEEAVSDTQNTVKAGETIQISINASLGDLVPADDTKATAKSVVRLEWADGDRVQAYCGTTKISDEDGLTVTPSENKMFASLTGNITAPEAGKMITFVYSNGCSAEGLIFDFSSQDKTDGIPFVAYGTLEYDGKAISDKMVGFNFATSVMKIVATDLGGGTISNAIISGINTKVTLAPGESGDPAITGGTPDKIASTNFAASSDGKLAIITLGVVPDSNKGRNIAVSQTDYTNKGVITAAEIKSSTSYTTPTALFPCGTLGTGENAHDYVLVAGTKWATQNLAVSESGKGAWGSAKLPGTTVPAQTGDYFQWGAHIDYVKEENNDKGLLLYTSFRNNVTTSHGNFTMKKDNDGKEYQFEDESISPYLENGTYNKYTSEDGLTTLLPYDDVAWILWGDAWRIPTFAELKALFESTYWKWDGSDYGFYVYAPLPGDAGKYNEKKESIGSYDDKSAALLFFPASGEGKFYPVGSYGRYWVSSLLDIEYAKTFGFYDYRVGLDANGCRYDGYTVRPVSD